LIDMKRLALIGCGRIAQHHARAISHCSHLNLVAVCDLNPSLVSDFSNLYDVEGFTNYHEMLNRLEIDVVAIITPSGIHYEHVKSILSIYHKDVIVEKPTFLKVSHVTEAYRLAQSLGLSIFPIFQNRFNNAVQRVYSGLQSGELGDIVSVNISVKWCRTQKYYDLSPWRGTFALDGGCLSNQGIHHIDLITYLCGSVCKVSSSHKTLGSLIEVEDTAVAHFELSTGAVGSLEITTAARPNDFEATLSLVCSNGIAKIGGVAVNELQIYTPDSASCIDFSEDFSSSIYGNGHLKLYESIERSYLDTSEHYLIPLQDVVSTISLLNSFYLSHSSGASVNPLLNQDSPLLGNDQKELYDMYRTPYSPPY